MFELVTALTGVSLATAGVLLFFNNRSLGNRTVQRELLALILLVGGGAVVLTTYTLNVEPELAFNPDQLMESAPPASGGGPLLPHRKITVLAWGTPSDTDSADETQVSSYTQQLQELASDVMKSYAPEAGITTRSMTREEYGVLVSSPLALTDWCERYDADLLLAVGIGTTKVQSGDYALWREPVYEVLDCRSARTQRITSRINERAGDRFPYQVAVSSDLRKLLDELIASN